jgi:hypothetical protein
MQRKHWLASFLANQKYLCNEEEQPIMPSPIRRQGTAQSGDRSDGRQQAYLDFVLAHYVQDGVDERDQSKLATLLRLKDSAIPDAIASRGKPDEISRAFVGFQKYLYQQSSLGVESTSSN